MSKATFLVAGSIVASSVLFAQQQTSPKFEAKANIVVVPVSVRDATGRFVFGLTAADFTVAEDGRARDIVQFSAEPVPASIALLVDASDSIVVDPKTPSDSAWVHIRQSLQHFANRLLPEDEVSLSVFRDRPQVVVPWTIEHARILQTADVTETGGHTALFNSVRLAAEMFRSARHGRKVLLLISDGQDTSFPGANYESSTTPTPDTAAYRALERAEVARRRRSQAEMLTRHAVNRSDALVYTIAVGRLPDITTLNGLVGNSGGYVERPGSLSEIADAVSRICDDLQAQYVLAFEPGHYDGKDHRISVTVNKTGTRVRARGNYVAAKGRP